MESMGGGLDQSSSSSNDSEPKAQPQEEERKQGASSQVAHAPSCMHCSQDAISFCASCGGDLCAEHDSTAHSAEDASSAAHARVMQEDKAALWRAMTEGSESAFHKSAESCKASVQGVLHTLAEGQMRLKLEARGNEGRSIKRASSKETKR